MTRSVDVDGLSVRVRTANLEERTAGQAVVIFESGGSVPLETWDPILSTVADFAPLIAYDRAGTGESAWDGLPPTPERVGARLTRLLSGLDARPPYILVGHSWGGALVRYFAGAHPDQVAAILYIDPTDITLRKTDLVALFESFGASAAEYEAFARTMREAMASAPAPLRAESDVIMSVLDGDLQEPLASPSVPASVIVAGTVGVPPQRLLPFDARLYAEAMHESQVRRLRGWVQNGGSFRVAANSGHFVQAEDPELVIREIRSLVDRTR